MTLLLRRRADAKVPAAVPPQDLTLPGAHQLLGVMAAVVGLILLSGALLHLL